MFYIRFTSDIYADIERGFSKDFRNGAKLEGLCAWPIKDSELSPYASKSEIKESAKKTAKMIAGNTYGGYSSDRTYAILEGKYVGNSNDGVLIEVENVISIETL